MQSWDESDPLDDTCERMSAIRQRLEAMAPRLEQTSSVSPASPSAAQATPESSVSPPLPFDEPEAGAPTCWARSAPYLALVPDIEIDLDALHAAEATGSAETLRAAEALRARLSSVLAKPPPPGVRPDAIAPPVVVVPPVVPVDDDVVIEHVTDGDEGVGESMADETPVAATPLAATPVAEPPVDEMGVTERASTSRVQLSYAARRRLARQRRMRRLRAAAVVAGVAGAAAVLAGIGVAQLVDRRSDTPAVTAVDEPGLVEDVPVAASPGRTAQAVVPLVDVYEHPGTDLVISLANPTAAGDLLTLPVEIQRSDGWVLVQAPSAAGAWKGWVRSDQIDVIGGDTPEGPPQS